MTFSAGISMDEARRAALNAWLSAAARAAVVISAASLLPGGAIQQNWALSVTRGAAAEEWVLRTDNAATLAVSLSRTAEYALLRAAFAEGVTVPEPLFGCDDTSIIGAPFFVMRRVAGTATGFRLAKAAAAQGGDDALVAALGAELARIHGIRPPREDLGFLALRRTMPVRISSQQCARGSMQGARHARPWNGASLRWRGICSRPSLRCCATMTFARAI